jgi:hypothetical protein
MVSLGDACQAAATSLFLAIESMTHGLNVSPMHLDTLTTAFCRLKEATGAPVAPPDALPKNDPKYRELEAFYQHVGRALGFSGEALPPCPGPYSDAVKVELLRVLAQLTDARSVRELVSSHIVARDSRETSLCGIVADLIQLADSNAVAAKERDACAQIIANLEWPHGPVSSKRSLVDNVRELAAVAVKYQQFKTMMDSLFPNDRGGHNETSAILASTSKGEPVSINVNSAKMAT